MIFKNTLLVRNIMILVFVFIFFITNILSIRIARNITKPIEDLTMKMKKVEGGDFTIKKNILQDTNRLDEIGMLQNSFELMMDADAI